MTTTPTAAAAVSRADSDPFVCDDSNSVNGAVSHQDVDFVVKTERVLAVLDHTIQRAQLALCLPLLLRHDATLLRPILSPEDLAQVTAACSKYGRRGSFVGDPPSSTMASYRSSVDSQRAGSGPGGQQRSGRRGTSASQTIRRDSGLGQDDQEQADQQPAVDRWSNAMKAVGLGVTSPPGPRSRQDAALSRALNTLWDNAEVRAMVGKQLLPLVSSTGTLFLEYLSRLRRVAADRLSRTPEAERGREAELCAAWRGGRQLGAERASLEARIRDQATQLGGQVADKARGIALLRHNVNLVRRQCQDEVKLIVDKSERAMVLEWRNSEYRQENLKTELNEATDKMAATLAAHLAEEKELRTKRHKMETLLMTWLQKFDTDVGEKFNEHEELTAEYENEAQQMRELTERMQAQDDEYRAFMAEKQRYEKEEEDEVVFALASKHAAKVIQRTWRAYRLRKRLAKAAKKKGKGKGKGKGKAKPKPK